MTDDAAHNRPAHEGDADAVRGHLSAETLNAYLDGDLAPADLSRADAHLQTCAACRRDLADLRATVTLLRGLPQHRPRRSFQLSSTQAQAPRGSWLLRFIPSLPALRTATAVVAMLLIAVITGDVVSNLGEDQSESAQEAPSTGGASREVAPADAAPAPTPTVSAAQPTPTEIPPAITPTPPPNDEAEPPAAPRAAEPTTAPGAGAGADGESAAAQAAEEAPTEPAPADEAPAAAAPVDDGAGESDAERDAEEPPLGAFAPAQPTAPPATATVTPAPTPSPSPTVTPSPSPSPSPSPPPPTATASPTPAPTPTPVVEPGGGDRPSLWRIAEIGLGLLLLWLIVSIIGAQRLRRP